MNRLHWHPSKGCPGRLVVHTCVVAALWLGLLRVVSAVNIEELRVSENDGVYQVELASEVDAPAEYVYKILTDYVHIYRLSSSIIESRILPSPREGVVRVRTRILDCILIFCMELDRVEDVQELPSRALRVSIVPSLSNFRSGITNWSIEETNGGSQLIYKAVMEPDFVIVPIIGPVLIKKKLRTEMISSLKRIECAAKIEQELDWNPHLRAAEIDVASLCGDDCDSVTGQC